MRLVLRSNANAGVAHSNMQYHLVFQTLGHPHPHQHFALCREFDRVAGQIDQDLLQAHGVANQGLGDGRIHVEQDFHRLGPDVG